MNQKSFISSDLGASQLIVNLESQLEMHKVLLEALKSEGMLPASCSLAELKEVQAIRDFAVQRIAELERNRLVLIDTYKRKNGIKQQISLLKIIQQCDPEDRKHLLSLRQNLLDIISEIKPAGKRNAEIAVARISCFNEIQGVIDKSFNRTTTYSGKGIITKAKGSSRMNRSI